MDIKHCFQVGYVTRPHGLKGEVTAILTEPIDLDSVSNIFIEINGHLVPYFISSYSERPDKVFIQFEETTTLIKAEELKGCHLYLPKSVRPSLKRGNFYNDEVIGFNVEDEAAGMLGTIKDVMQSGLGRLIQVINNEDKEILIPVDSPFIKSVNKSKRLIKVTLPEGYLDI